MVESILKETAQRHLYLQSQTVETVYFGGGTPSLLNPAELSSILRQVQSYFNLSLHPEITIEVNPDDLTREYADRLIQVGFNRLSIGIQSFRSEDMKYMHRAHTPSQSFDAIHFAQMAGFENISADLIYGLPGSKMDQWKNNLFAIAEKKIQHLSCYALTIEPKTQLAHQINQKKSQAPDETETIDQLEYLIQNCNQFGFEQYEISNFALPGFESKHNGNYWRGVDYLGLGPSAHSYNGVSRQWNISNNVKYIKALEHDLPYYEIESLTPSMKYNEFVLTRLRTMKGIYASDIPSPYRFHFQTEVKPMIENGYITYIGDHYRLTAQGIYIADKLSADLFV